MGMKNSRRENFWVSSGFFLMRVKSRVLRCIYLYLQVVVVIESNTKVEWKIGSCATNFPIKTGCNDFHISP